MKLSLNPRFIALSLIIIGLGVSLYAISLPLRASAQKRGCQTNLKQIGLATMQYTRDYDELFMLAPEWKEQLAPYSKFYRKPTLAPDYTCPTTSLGYAFNEGLSGVPITLVKSPRTMAMFYEPLRSVTADRGESWNSAGVHGKGSNVCFHDGHVQWVQTRPAFWVPEFALKEAEVRRRGEQARRIIAAELARRQRQQKQKRIQPSKR